MEVGQAGPKHAAHPVDGPGFDRAWRHAGVCHRWDRLLDCGGPHDDWCTRLPRRIRTRTLVGERSALAGVVPRQRHQVWSPPQGRRRRTHCDREANEGRRTHREGHRQVPGRRQGDSLPVPRRIRSGLTSTDGGRRPTPPRRVLAWHSTVRVPVASWRVGSTRTPAQTSSPRSPD